MYLAPQGTNLTKGDEIPGTVGFRSISSRSLEVRSTGLAFSVAAGGAQVGDVGKMLHVFLECVGEE